MSKLTVEERTFLQSLECRDKAQAISVLSELEQILPVRSELFRTVLALSYKLKNEHIDYAYEMKTVAEDFDEEEEFA